MFLLLTIGIEIVKKVYNPTRIIYFALQGKKMISSLGNIVLSLNFLILSILHSKSEASSLNSKQNLGFDNLIYTVAHNLTYFFIT